MLPPGGFFRERYMKLRAWIKRSEQGVTAKLLARGTARLPAERLCRGESEAVRWIVEQAEALQAPIEWA